MPRRRGGRVSMTRRKRERRMAWKGTRSLTSHPEGLMMLPLLRLTLMPCNSDRSEFALRNYNM
jgi:hypothetical protein